jgi:putative endonuclease
MTRHREGKGGRFTSRHQTTKLVYVEEYPTIEDAIAREKAVKAWKRMWKIDAIERMNPAWDDLFERINCQDARAA